MKAMFMIRRSRKMLINTLVSSFNMFSLPRWTTLISKMFDLVRDLVVPLLEWKHQSGLLNGIQLHSPGKLVAAALDPVSDPVHAHEVER